MSELKKLRLQQEATAAKIAAQISKDTERLAREITELAEQSGKDQKDIISLIDMALSLAEETQQSISELLKLEQPVSVVASPTAKDPKWKEFKQKKNGKDFILPNGDRITLKLMGRNNHDAEAAWKAGTLKEA